MQKHEKNILLHEVLPIRIIVIFVQGFILDPYKKTFPLDFIVPMIYHNIAEYLNAITGTDLPLNSGTNALTLGWVEMLDIVGIADIVVRI